jgi:hypothetical protein
MKTCTKCKEQKDLAEFPKAKQYKDGVRNECKKCYTAYMTSYYNSNPDKKAAKVAMNSGKDTNWKRHKITEEQYIIMLNKYDGKCYSCKDREATCIDHDHSCCNVSRRSCGNCIRGLLCHNCNTALGLMKDNKESILLLVEYIS